MTLLVLTVSCVAPARRDFPGHSQTSTWQSRIDWTQATEELTQSLSGYLQVDTFNPPGNELRGARFLAELLDKEGISSEIVEHAPGRASVIARLSGNGREPPLCMLSHIDVVTAEAHLWPSDRGPLSGAIFENEVWGRGALDMKGMGILELYTLAWLKRLNVPLRRDVILLAVADEEVSGLGMRDLTSNHWERIGCSHLVNEGGVGLKDLLLPGQTVYPISSAEKGVLWLRMTAKGPPGHGSTPTPGRAPDRLIKALQAIARRQPEPRFHASVLELMRASGAEAGGVKGAVMTRPALAQRFARGRMMEAPLTRAGLIDTVQVTGLGGKSDSPNVVPSEVSAILDCRLLPGSSRESLLSELGALVDDPDVSFEVLNYSQANESPWEDPFFAALARHAGKNGPTAHWVAGPVLTIGFTDSSYARRVGTRAYGLIPFELTSEELGRMHGTAERVSIQNLQHGLRALLGAVLDVSADG